MLRQFHIAHNLWLQRPSGVGQGRAAEAGIELLGDRGPANQLAALQHQRLESRFGQIEGSDQAVVASTDDDYVAHTPASLPLRKRVSFHAISNCTFSFV